MGLVRASHQRDLRLDGGPQSCVTAASLDRLSSRGAQAAQLVGVPAMIGMRDDRIGGIFPHGSEQHAMRISSVSWRTICREPERQAAESIVAERRTPELPQSLRLRQLVRRLSARALKVLRVARHRLPPQPARRSHVEALATSTRGPCRGVRSG